MDFYNLVLLIQLNVAENDNSFNPVPRITANADGLVTAEEKAQKKNNVKARSMLLMALPNEHLLTFNQYKDSKTLFEAQARFGGNDATKKTQKILLKHMYDNFNAPSTDATSTPVSTVSSPNNTANLGDATVYAFLANQPNGSQLVHEDLEQIHEDDLEEMDLKWQLPLMSMRARRSPRNQESKLRNQDSSRKTVIVEDTSSKALVAIDGASFDWSYLGDDEVPTNMALMAFSDSEGDPQASLRDTGIFNSRCSQHMIGNKSFLSDYQEYDGGFVAFAGSFKGGKITGIFNSRCSQHMIGNKSFLSDCQEYDGGFVAFAGSFKGGKITVNTTRYVQNRVLVTKLYNKKPYELLIGRAPIISFMRPFGCPDTILNTLDHLGKFDGKANKGFLVGYSLNSKAFRVYNSKTKKVKENMHVNFLENKPNVTRSGPEWLFDIDSLTNSMNYQPVSAGNRTNGIAGSKIHSDVGQEGKEKVSDQEYILLPVLNTSSEVPSSNEEVESSPKDNAGKKSIVEPTCIEGGKIDNLGCLDQQMKSTYDFGNTNSTISFNTAINFVGSSLSHPAALDDFSKMPNLEDTGIFDDAYDDRDEGAEADCNNLEPMEPKKVTQALDDESQVEAMQEELL
nr:retrovirus-related Pol polyprotein from transposon TNT 1-94 [Tanacetum cinerariifolium]